MTRRTHYSKDSKIADLVHDLISEHGWRFDKSRGRHSKIISPDGSCLSVPANIGDDRAYLNFRAQVRRIQRAT